MTFRRALGGTTMRRTGRGWIVVGLLVVPLLLAACGGTAAEEAVQPPAVAKQIKGTDITQVTLTAEAARRLGVRTVAVRSDGAGTVIPYQAVLYDPNGETWAYTSPKPLVFQRADISVARIVGNSAILTTGPSVGTAVVTAGATEIWGVEYGGIEED
jgi:hypothetical protein